MWRKKPLIYVAILIQIYPIKAYKVYTHYLSIPILRNKFDHSGDLSVLPLIPGIHE